MISEKRNFKEERGYVETTKNLVKTMRADTRELKLDNELKKTMKSAYERSSGRSQGSSYVAGLVDRSVFGTSEEMPSSSPCYLWELVPEPLLHTKIHRCSSSLQME